MKVIRVLKSMQYNPGNLEELSREVRSWPGVGQALVVMGSDENKITLQQMGFWSSAIRLAGPGDLVIALVLETSTQKTSIFHRLRGEMNRT